MASRQYLTGFGRFECWRLLSFDHFSVDFVGTGLTSVISVQSVNILSFQAL